MVEFIYLAYCVRCYVLIFMSVLIFFNEILFDSTVNICYELLSNM